MSFREKIVTLVLLSFPCIYEGTAATPSNWILDAPIGAYLDAANWDNGIPTNGGPGGNIPVFGPTISQNCIVQYAPGTAIAVDSIVFNNPLFSYNFQYTVPGPTDFHITGNPISKLTVQSGNHTVSALSNTAVFLQFFQDAVIEVDASSVLNFSNTFTQVDTEPLTLTGSGKINVVDSVINTLSATTTLDNINVTLTNDVTNPTVRTALINTALIMNNNSTLLVTNAADITASTFIASGVVNRFFTLNSGSVTFNNFVNVSASGSASVGMTNTVLPFSVFINNGTLNLTNEGQISGGNSFGALVRSVALNDNMTVTESQINLINTGNILDGGGIGLTNVGVMIGPLASLTLSGAELNISNSGSVSGFAVGAEIEATNILQSEVSINLTNNGPINGVNAVGSLFDTTSGLTINNTSLTITNLSNGVITQGTGSEILIGQNFMLNGGNLDIINQASVSDGLGSVLQISGNAIINSSVVNIRNVGQITGGGFGSLLKTENITLNKSLILNDGNVLTDTLSIDPSSTYSGIGFISNLTPGTTLAVTNNGTVLPGDEGIAGAPGIMNIDGSYVQTPFGKLVIDFEDSSRFSKLIVTGSAEIAGTLEVAETLDANIVPGQVFQVLQANGGVTGTFSSFVDFNIPYGAPHAIYLPNAVEVFFTPVTHNYINLSRPIFSSVNETYTRLTREMERVRLRFTRPKEEKITFSKKRSSSAWYDEPSQYIALAEDIIPQEKRGRLTESMETSKERLGNFYIGPKGQFGNVVSKEDMQGYSYWTAGVFTGFDYAFSEIGIGFLSEYERIEADIGKKWGKFDIDTVHVDAYATYAPLELSELSFNAIVGGGYEWYRVERNINQMISHTLKGAPHGAEFDALLGMEYSFRDSVFTAMPERLQIIPMASVEYMYLHINDYTECGFQPHALHVSKQNVKSLRSNLGFRISYIWHRTENIDISPQVNFNWQREYLDKERNINFLPVEFSDYGFSLALPKVGRNTALAGIDVLVTLFKRHGLEAGYDFEYNPLYHTHFLYLSYNVGF